MKNRSPASADARRARLALAVLLTAGLSACGGFGGGPRGEPERVVNLPPVPRVDISAGNATAAERSLRAMVTQYPELAGPRINLATLLIERGEDAEALTLAREAIAQNPRSADGYNILGMAERRAGNFDAARSAYEKALIADPAHAKAQLNLGILYDLYLQRPAQALTAYEAFQAAQDEADPQVDIWIADVKRRVE